MISPSRTRRLRQKFESAQRRLNRGEFVVDRYATLLADLRDPLEAMQRGESVDPELRALCRAVTTDAALIARHGAELSGHGRDPETARRVIAAFGEALKASPGDPRLCHNFGGYLSYLGDWDNAAKALSVAADGMPRDVAPLVQLGFCHARRNRMAEANQCWNIALAIADAKREPDWSVAQLRLMRGDWTRGWQDYEARVSAPFGAYRPKSRAPKWDGSPVKRLLVYGEQGAGDLLMMLRYIRPVSERAQEVTCVVPPSMLSFMQSTRSPVTFIADGEPLPEHDAAISWMSFPAVFRTTVETVPPNVFYPTSAPEPGRVGICWHGDSRHANDHVRSAYALPDVLQATVTNWGYEPMSLQYGEALPGRSGAVALNGDWLDTAWKVASCSLVITVDTSIAHLAGTLGVPTWLLLPEPAEWRWLQGREDTPWYESVTLIRQTTPGDWNGVVEQVIQKLEAM